MTRPIVAVIGAANASAQEKGAAYEAGKLIAKKGWILVSGGLTGVMEEASHGAADGNGIVVGILPTGFTADANKYVNIPIATNIGFARNAIIAHTADILIAVGGEYGTLSEIAMSRKLGKPVFAIKSWEIADTIPVQDAAEAIELCQKHLDLHFKKTPLPTNAP